MTLLRPYIAFNPRETLLSYAARLSAFHTGMGPHRLLKDLGVPFNEFTAGKLGAVERFADATGNSIEALERVLITVHPRHTSFMGNRCSKNFISPRAARYCPDCLGETAHRDDWQHQLIWCVRHVYRCPLHGQWLKPTDDRTAVDLRKVVRSKIIDRDHEEMTAIPKYLLWVEDQLSGRGASDSWMSEQSMEQVLNASEMIGAVLQHGHKVSLRKLDVGEQECATEVGFTIYSDGPQAIEAALTEVRNSSPATAVQAGPLAMYGQLFDWLDRRSNAVDPGPIRDLLREHIIKHSAVDSGEVVLGVETMKRKYHSMQSLTHDTGIERRRLSRLMQKLGFFPAGTTDADSGRLVFAADEVINFINDYGSAVSLSEVPEYLGASKHQIESLYAAEILSPLIPRDARGAVRNVVFSRRHLDELLAQVMRLSEAKAGAPENLNTIAYACQRSGGTTPEVITHILEGTLRAFRLTGKFGLASVVVSPTEAVKLRKQAA